MQPEDLHEEPVAVEVEMVEAQLDSAGRGARPLWVFLGLALGGVLVAGLAWLVIGFYDAKMTTCEAWTSYVGELDQDAKPCGVTFMGQSARLEWQGERLRAVEDINGRERCIPALRALATRPLHVRGPSRGFIVELDTKRISHPQLQERRVLQELPDGGRVELVEDDREGDGEFEVQWRHRMDDEGRSLELIQSVDGLEQWREVWERGPGGRLERVVWRSAELSEVREVYEYCE